MPLASRASDQEFGRSSPKARRRVRPGAGLDESELRYPAPLATTLNACNPSGREVPSTLQCANFAHWLLLPCNRQSPRLLFMATLTAREHTQGRICLLYMLRSHIRTARGSNRQPNEPWALFFETSAVPASIIPSHEAAAVVWQADWRSSGRGRTGAHDQNGDKERNAPPCQELDELEALCVLLGKRRRKSTNAASPAAKPKGQALQARTPMCTVAAP